MSSAFQPSGFVAESLTELGVATPGNDSSWAFSQTLFYKHHTKTDTLLQCALRPAELVTQQVLNTSAMYFPG